MWDESPLRKWTFHGKDALAAADRIFTNDMLGLEIGQVRYAPFCDENGKMVGDGTVLKFGEDSCLRVAARPAGRTLTSPCESPTLGKTIGMAVLKTRYAQKGERLEVAVGEGTAPATVDDFPIYDPEKRRPRS